MAIDEALAKVKKYEEIVDRYVSSDKFNTNDNGGWDSYWKVRGACLEALAILEGDEEKFKGCLDAAKKKDPGMGWGFDFDMYNAQKAADYVKTLAHLMRK